MFIEKRLWDWLNWVGFDQEILDPEVQDNRSYLLREDFLEGLFKGAVFKDILQRIASQHEIPFEKQQILDHITPGDTPTSLGYNWDLILEFLSQIGFTVDKQIVDKMRGKDNSVMKDFLSDLTDTFPVKKPAASAANSTALLLIRQICFKVEFYQKECHRTEPE
jgi:hypothetical protein